MLPESGKNHLANEYNFNRDSNSTHTVIVTIKKHTHTRQ